MTVILESKVAGMHVRFKRTETGEPQYWIMLPDGRVSVARTLQELERRFAKEDSKVTASFTDGISMKQAVKLTGYSDRWIGKQIREGKIEVAKNGKYIAGISQSSLESFVKQHLENGTQHGHRIHGPYGKRRGKKFSENMSKAITESWARRKGKINVKAKWALGGEVGAFGLTAITRDGAVVAYAKAEAAKEIVTAMNALHALAAL